MSDSESFYTESEDDIDQDTDMITISKSINLMGINVRNSHRFMSTIKKKIKEQSPKDQDSIKSSI